MDEPKSKNFLGLPTMALRSISHEYTDYRTFLVEKQEDKKRARKMWRNFFIVFTALSAVGIVFAVAAFCLWNSEQGKSIPPHIIFILVDDLGWNDVSFHGSPQIPTPNIDALAASGVVLNNYYTHPQCTPSRGALLTGKYPNRLGLQHDVILETEPIGLPLNETILPQYLKKLGYKSHLVGKWHMGHYKTEYMPTRRGFDTFFGYVNGFIDYYDYTSWSEFSSAEKGYLNFGIDLWENEEVIKDFRGEYATDLFTKKAIDVIKNHDISSPLFLLLSHLAPHVGSQFMPLQALPKQVAKNRHINDLKRRTYAGVVSSLDDSIGKVFEVLHERNLLNNTIIVLSSDNGGVVNGHSGGRASNWPLRGMKFHVWEGGVRVVGLIWSPLLHLKDQRTSMHMMHISDWLPTLYEAAGGDVQDFGDIDGVSAWGVLTEKNATSPREEIFIFMDPFYDMASLRQGEMKLIFSSYSPSENGWYGPSGFEDGLAVESLDEWVWKNGSIIRNILMDTGQWLLKKNDIWRQSSIVSCGESLNSGIGKCNLVNPCLFNITSDPCERKNIAELYPEVVSSMLSRIKELNALSVYPLSTSGDPRGDPRCHEFVYESWLDPEHITSCPYL